MAKPKTRERFNSTLSKELLTRLRELSDETRIPASRLLDEAIEDLLLKYESRGRILPRPKGGDKLDK